MNDKLIGLLPGVFYMLLTYFAGLSKEGWYIFKNLVTEFFILFVGFFTFVPAIQVSDSSIQHSSTVMYGFCGGLSGNQVYITTV